MPIDREIDLLILLCRNFIGYSEDIIYIEYNIYTFK